jgi:hypothetical protein
MKVVDRVETQERVERLTEEQKDDLFTSLTNGKDVTEEIETSRGKFTVKFPKVSDFLLIGKVAASRRENKPPSAFDMETEMINMMASTLDVVVVSGPKWFEDAKTRNKNFSFLDVPGRAFLTEFYGKAYMFREKVEQRLNPAKESGDKPTPAKTGDNAAVDGGAFGNPSSE